MKKAMKLDYEQYYYAILCNFYILKLKKEFNLIKHFKNNIDYC